MISAIAGAFGGVSGGAGESGSIFGGINSAIGGFGLGSNPGDGAPAAFLNYILFDRNYAVVDMGWAAVPSGAPMSRQQIAIPTVNVTKAGFIFVYLSYEDQSNNSVEFDDLAITVTPSNLVQYNEYYPFGLQTQQSWTRENVKNNFLYNGGSELNTSSGWYDLPFRNYDAALGRFFQVDALATYEHTLTPYQYAGNNPIVFNDPTGLLKATAGQFAEFVTSALAGNGGTWSNDSGPHLFTDDEADAMNESFEDGGTGSGSYFTSVGNGMGTGIAWYTAGGYFNMTISTGIMMGNSGVIDNVIGSFESMSTTQIAIPEGPLRETAEALSGSQEVGNWFNKHWFTEIEGHASYGLQSTFIIAEGELIPQPYSNSSQYALNANLSSITYLAARANNREGLKWTTLSDLETTQGGGASFMGNSISYDRSTIGNNSESTLRGSTLFGLLGVEVNLTTGSIFIGMMPEASFSLGVGAGGSMKGGFKF